MSLELGDIGCRNVPCILGKPDKIVIATPATWVSGLPARNPVCQSLVQRAAGSTKAGEGKQR